MHEYGSTWTSKWKEKAVEQVKAAAAKKKERKEKRVARKEKRKSLTSGKRVDNKEKRIANKLKRDTRGLKRATEKGGVMGGGKYLQKMNKKNKGTSERKSTREDRRAKRDTKIASRRGHQSPRYKSES